MWPVNRRANHNNISSFKLSPNFVEIAVALTQLLNIVVTKVNLFAGEISKEAFGHFASITITIHTGINENPLIIILSMRWFHKMVCRRCSIGQICKIKTHLNTNAYSDYKS